MGDKYLGLPAVISFGTISEPCAVDAPELICQGDVPYRTIVMLIGLVRKFYAIIVKYTYSVVLRWFIFLSVVLFTSCSALLVLVFAGTFSTASIL